MPNTPPADTPPPLLPLLPPLVAPAGTHVMVGTSIAKPGAQAQVYVPGELMQRICSPGHTDGDSEHSSTSVHFSAPSPEKPRGQVHVKPRTEAGSTPARPAARLADRSAAHAV
jgi:hypothetical protein